MTPNYDGGRPLKRGTPQRLDGWKMLVVDDIQAMRNLLAQLLARTGAQVRTADSARSALAAIADERPDLIVTDLGMPEIDGFGLLDRVRRLPPESGRDIAAIAVTGFTGSNYRERCLAAGFHDHLAKPVDMSLLLDAIVRALANGRGESNGSD